MSGSSPVSGEWNWALEVCAGASREGRTLLGAEPVGSVMDSVGAAFDTRAAGEPVAG